LYWAHLPLFKVTKANKATYIKDEKELEKFIINTTDKKISKNKSDFNNF